MPTYLVFRELPGVTRDQFVAAQRTAMAKAAAARAAGQPVWYLRGFFLPARAVALCLFEGPDQQVKAVNQQAGVPYTAVVEAIEATAPTAPNRAWLLKPGRPPTATAGRLPAPSSAERHLTEAPLRCPDPEKETQHVERYDRRPAGLRCDSKCTERKASYAEERFQRCGYVPARGVTVVPATDGSAVPASAAASTSPNLVVNGNFAAPPVKASAGALESSSQNQTGFTGWKVTAPVASLDATDYLNPAPGGSQAFVLGNGFGQSRTPNTGISQVVATTLRSAYSLTLEYSASGQQGCPVGSVETGQAMWDGAVVGTYSVAVRASDAQVHGRGLSEYIVAWHSVQAVVTATAPSSTLALGWATTSCTPNIGAVSLTAVPVAAVTNGFSLLPIAGAPNASASPYGTAERQVLAKLPAGVHHFFGRGAHCQHPSQFGGPAARGDRRAADLEHFAFAPVPQGLSADRDHVRRRRREVPGLCCCRPPILTTLPPCKRTGYPRLRPRRRCHRGGG